MERFDFILKIVEENRGSKLSLCTMEFSEGQIITLLKALEKNISVSTLTYKYLDVGHYVNQNVTTAAFKRFEQ